MTWAPLPIAYQFLWVLEIFLYPCLIVVPSPPILGETVILA